jgi:hypothetical protein
VIFRKPVGRDLATATRPLQTKLTCFASASNLVIAVQSAWRQSRDSEADVETFRLIGAAVRALRPDPAS